MGVQAPVHFKEGVDYGGWMQEVTVDEVDEVADGEEGDVRVVGDAVYVTPQGGAAAPQGGGVGGSAPGDHHGSDVAVQPSPAQPAGQWGRCPSTRRHRRSS